MIQRIQSIYLFSSLVFLLICFFASFGQIGSNVLGMYHITTMDGTIVPSTAFYIYLPITLAVILNVWAIFGFKNRTKQMAIIRFTFILIAVIFILATLMVMNAKELLANETYVPGMAFISPAFAFVCNSLALRAIRKDEALVRSVNRIR